MAYRSESAKKLQLSEYSVEVTSELDQLASSTTEICAVILPSCADQVVKSSIFADFLAKIAANLAENGVLITLGDPKDLTYVHNNFSTALQYQLWVSVKRETPIVSMDKTALPNSHFGILIHTKYRGSLRHTITRIKYSYCPSCGKTTKDYGGKKHTFDPYGTLLSDVWRDTAYDYEGDLHVLFHRLADLFGIEPYQTIKIIDCRRLLDTQAPPPSTAAKLSCSISGNGSQIEDEEKSFSLIPLHSELILGDCVEILSKVSDNSIDFCFADPPYNLKKNYHDFKDDLEVIQYFDWCDKWLSEMARVLKPGRTLAVLNIPLWSIRHFLFLNKGLQFQNWIVWDSLSFPVRRIMPANYCILIFSKGRPRPLPGFMGLDNPLISTENDFVTGDILFPQAEGYCSRKSCKTKRQREGVKDKSPLTDVWWDIHRLKHNSRRVEHPCQLPPLLMYRLISLFTQRGEIVLDCFNGTGTTTLAAHILGRQYIGIEKSNKYYEIANARHDEIFSGLDPFRKQKRELIVKNSPVKRMDKRKYQVTKKELQLEVKRIALALGRVPSKAQALELTSYPRNYFDEYFQNWGEACAAARHNGMSENGDKPLVQKLNENAVLDRPSIHGDG